GFVQAPEHALQRLVQGQQFGTLRLGRRRLQAPIPRRYRGRVGGEGAQGSKLAPHDPAGEQQRGKQQTQAGRTDGGAGGHDLFVLVLGGRSIVHVEFGGSGNAGLFGIHDGKTGLADSPIGGAVNREIPVGFPRSRTNGRQRNLGSEGVRNHRPRLAANLVHRRVPPARRRQQRGIEEQPAAGLRVSHQRSDAG